MAPLQDILKANGLPVQADKEPKTSFLPYHSNSVPRVEDLAARAHDHVAGGTQRDATTMMLRNVPSKYSQNSLLQEIDSLDFAGTYDFFYLPMDLHNRCNVGYGFINFVLAEDAERFRRVFSDHHFLQMKRKAGSVCVAHVQGLAENLKHFEDRAITKVTNDQYRPVILKNGRRISFQDALAEVKGVSKAAAPRATTAVAACGEASSPVTHARRRRAQSPQRKAQRRVKAQLQQANRLPLPVPSQAPVCRGDQQAQVSLLATDAVESLGARENLDQAIYQLLEAWNVPGAGAGGKIHSSSKFAPKESAPAVVRSRSPEICELLQFRRSLGEALGPDSLGGHKRHSFDVADGEPAYVNIWSCGTPPEASAGAATPPTRGLYLAGDLGPVF